MTPADFRALGHRMVDHIADYLASVGERPVSDPALAPGATQAKLPSQPPEPPGDAAEWDAIFQDIERIVQPALLHWQHPGFFGYFPANGSGPAILGEMLSAGLGVQGMLWSTSPACTEIETRMLDWMASACALPDRFHSTSTSGGGVIQSTASEATLVALVAARDRALRAACIDFHEHPVVYCTDQSHSSVVKAAMIAGVARSAADTTHVRRIPTRADLSMDPAALRAALNEDHAAGRLPVMLCATLGTTGTGAFDPLPELVDVWRQHTDQSMIPWLHVDAAWAGAAMICPEHRALFAGLEHADSLCFNPHKWLLTSFDCDLFWTADRESLTRALSVTPEYLRNDATDAGRVWDYRDWQIPLGRRFRALKLWFVIRHYGLEGLRAHVRSHVEWTDELASLIEADDNLEIVTPPSLALVTFRHTGGDGATRSLMRAANATGEVFLSHTAVPSAASPAYAIRFAIGATATRREHVLSAFELLSALAREAGA